MTKAPAPDRKIQKASWQHKNAIKNFDYTTIADRLRTASLGNDSHPIDIFGQQCMVNFKLIFNLL